MDSKYLYSTRYLHTPSTIQTLTAYTYYTCIHTLHTYIHSIHTIRNCPHHTLSATTYIHPCIVEFTACDDCSPFLYYHSPLPIHTYIHDVWHYMNVCWSVYGGGGREGRGAAEAYLVRSLRIGSFVNENPSHFGVTHDSGEVQSGIPIL